MKAIILVVASIFLISPNLYAKGGMKDKKPNMEEHKAKVLENLEKRISSLNEFKSCVNGAKEQGDIKNCRKAHQDRIKDLRPEGGRGRGRHHD
ncbi:MAG: hypothetical protein KDD33_10685 [Bdellovibrionales bacterium]|nr:hypothetical protein [Bdellovibrionales bacterium]